MKPLKRLRTIGTAAVAIAIGLAASVDRAETTPCFAASMGTGFPILSDPDKTVARAYGVLGASGFPARRTFFIGTDGRVLAIDADVRTASHRADIVVGLKHVQIPEQV